MRTKLHGMVESVGHLGGAKDDFTLPDDKEGTVSQVGQMEGGVMQ